MPFKWANHRVVIAINIAGRAPRQFDADQTSPALRQ